jgi:hypothetical protein
VVIDAIRAALTPYLAEQGVRLASATWIVTARSRNHYENNGVHSL